MTRKLFFSLLLICLGKIGYSQPDTSLLYLRFPTVPPFKLINIADSSHFTKDDLNKNKAVLIMIFSPDCEHCQIETKELIAHIKLFKNVQIIMASPLEHQFLKKFFDEYKIADYPNIIMGRDPAYFLGTFFKVRSFPALFLYDKKGNFIDKFDGNVPVEKIAQAL